MPTFDAGKAVPELTYDFRKFGGSKGTIPEPSDDILAKYSRDMAVLVNEELDEDVDPRDIRAVMRAAAEVSETELIEQQEKVAEVTAALCQDSPSKKELMDLKPRVRRAFYGWLNGQLNPED